MDDQAVSTQNQAPQAQPTGDQGVQVGTLKVKVNKSTCLGCGTCVSLAPNTFQLGADGKSSVKEGSTDSPETIKTAAESCPVKAIEVIDTETGKQV